jgi:hypothetical protein
MVSGGGGGWLVVVGWWWWWWWCLLFTMVVVVVGGGGCCGVVCCSPFFNGLLFDFVVDSLPIPTGLPWPNGLKNNCVGRKKKAQQ